MKIPFRSNQDGIALVTSLMMTFISLVIIMAVMYMITQNVVMTGSVKRYNTALEASYGGMEVIMKQIVPTVLENTFETNFSLFTVAYPNNATCNITTKLFGASSTWGASCSQTPDPKSVSDVTFQLPAVGGQAYTVYAKIIDTVLGNTDQSGEENVTGGVAESSSSTKAKHIPFVYRLEVQAERSTNATEQANLSVLYAY